MGLFDFLKRKESPDPGLLDALTALNFTGNVEGGSLCLTAPDGIEYRITQSKGIVHTPWGDVEGTEGSKEIAVRFRQKQPNKVLFSFSSSKGHFVNDPNPEGYRNLIDSLHSSRSAAAAHRAVYTFLLERYGKN